jgi:16S rRNA (guanine527-N7)-methyltransferase
VEKLKEKLETAGIKLKKEDFDKLESFFELLLKWNRVYNLTSDPPEKIPERHILNSLLPLKFLDDIKNEKKIACDVGSGAGFPGIPLAIVKKDWKFYLVEPRKKKCLFLEEVKRRLNLKNVEVVNKRIEETDFDCEVLFMRAVSPPEKAVSLVERYLQNGATLVFFAGKSSKFPSGFKVEEVKVLGERFFLIRM